MTTTEKKIQRLFATACAEKQLLQDGDHVLIALSGGKDSLQLVRLLGRQQKIYKPRITVEAAHVTMPNLYHSDTEYLTRFCQEQGVPLNIIKARDIQPRTTADATHNDGEPGNGKKGKPMCFLCSWHRRHALFDFARDHGFNKLALGHHQDDIIVTMLMNMTFEGSCATIPPAMDMRHYPLTVIRPMCLIPEHLITTVAQELAFQRQEKHCPHEHVTRRHSLTDIFRQLEQLNPEARYSLQHVIDNLQNNTIKEQP